MAGKTLTNPIGAFGYSDLQTELYHESAPVTANAVVSAGRVVAVNTLGVVAHAATNNTASLCIGIAEAAFSTGQTGQVTILGYASAVAQGAIAAGDTLVRSTTTTGSVMATATPGVGEKIGVAINASTGGLVDMWVCK